MDHYNTLGVAKTATPDEIKKAYRKLASQHHPDKGGDTAMFQKVEEAYRILSDPQKRQEYDNPMPQFNGGPGGFSFNANGFDFGDIIGQMFGQQRQHPHQPRQQVYRTSIDIDLTQAYYGGKHHIQLQTPTGNKMIEIDIPIGCENGSQVRVNEVIPNATLVVEFRIRKHLKYDRIGNDLICNQQISVLDLIAGGTFEFDTLGGKTLEVTIKPKTQPYMQVKLSGHGMPIYGRPNVFGDQIILLKPYIPDTIDQSIIDSINKFKNKQGVI
jgi:curved DNA-binding protein